MNQKKFGNKKSDLEKPVSLGVLLEYTDEFLIPRFSQVMDEKIEKRIKENNQILIKEMAKLEYNLKDYVDRKVPEYLTDAFKKLERTFQKDKAFKEKVVDLLKKHKIGSATDWAYLDGLVAGI